MKKKILILLSIILLTTGCTEYVKDDNKNVINENTGQTLTANILCQPSDKDTLNLYEEHKVEIINKVPTCEEFTITSNGYEGLWDTIFVKPLAYIILQLGYLVNNMGISVILIGIIIRLAMLPLTRKSQMQSENMKKANPEIKALEKKYKDKQDKDSMMMKSQETMMIYKKYNINPVSGCLVAFIQLPVFFAFLEAINRVPAIFEGEFFLGLKLGTTPWVGISDGNYIYIALIVLIILSTYLSFKNTMSSQTTDEMQTQMNFMMKIMLVTISLASFSLPTAIALYWIATNLFAVAQNSIINKYMKKKV